LRGEEDIFHIAFCSGYLSAVAMWQLVH